MQDIKLREDSARAAPAVGAEQDVQDLYLSAWFDSFFAPSVIVTLDLQLVWMNGAGEKLLARGAPFCTVGDRLACADKTQTAELRAFVEGLNLSTAIWACPNEAGGHLLVRGEGLRPTNAEPAAALIFVPADTAPEGYVWADLGEVFGLTRAEVAIVKRFVGGERADEMAEALGVTIETVRTHIRRIYNKLGINSREHLFSLVAPYRLR